MVAKDIWKRNWGGGNMEWKCYKIDELIDEISMGPFGSDVKKEFYVKKRVPILNGSNLQGFKLQEDSFGYLTEEKAKTLKKCIAQKGDIIVTHRGTLGQIVYVPKNSKYDKYVISQSQFRFRCKKDLVDVPYLVYYFHTREGQHKILANASQVGVPALARATSTFRRIEICLPPLAIQRRIASILSSLDRKIELNNKINADLEEMAQAIFKNWFVDFEPFKDGKFVDSELGMIPEGWKVGRLGELCDFKRGKNLLTKNAIDEGVPVVAGGLEPSCYHNVANTGAPVITVSGSGANAGFMRMYHVPVWASDCSFIDISCENFYFVYCFLKVNSKLLKHAQTGAVQPHVKPSDIHDFELVIPDKESIFDFQDKVKPFFDKIASILKENSRLSLLRDTLLPRLMSGELEVPE